MPSERVFSGSKQTITDERNCLSPILVEALQILKFYHHHTALNFSEDWVDTEEDTAWLDIDPTEAAQIFATGTLEQLMELLG